MLSILTTSEVDFTRETLIKLNFNFKFGSFAALPIQAKELPVSERSLEMDVRA